MILFMPDQLRNTLAILERTPSVLDTWLRGLPEFWTHGNYGPGTWCAFEVVGHLIKGEQGDWIPRMRIILEHGTARPFDPFPHDAAIHPDSGRSLDDLLDEFAELRSKNLEVLRATPITDELLTRRGRHPALGEVTLGQLLSTWAAHDLHHLAQVGKAMTNQHRERVGPWRDYFNTMVAKGAVGSPLL